MKYIPSSTERNFTPKQSEYAIHTLLWDNQWLNVMIQWSHKRTLVYDTLMNANDIILKKIATQM